MKVQIAVEVNLYGELVLYSSEGQVLYQGKPDGFTVSEACATEAGRIVVLGKTPEKAYLSCQNLLMLDRTGKIIWRAQLPQPSSADAYVSFTYEDGRILANSWSGYRVLIDPNNGRIGSAEFTK